MIKKFFLILFIMAVFPALFSATISVDNYGANGSDSIDDTSAIQNALNQLSSGEELIFNSGTYLISNYLSLTSNNVTITFMNNAKLKAIGNGLAAGLICSSDNVTFNNFYLDGNNICSTGLNLYICDNIIVNAPKIINIDGNFPPYEYDAEAIILRTCTNIEINDGYFKDIRSGSQAAATGILCISLSTTEKCYNISIDGCEFDTIEAISDGDGIKFLGLGIDVNSTIADSTFYNCSKRAIKLQNKNVQVTNVSIINDKMTTDFISSYLVDFQMADDCSLMNSFISVAGKDSGAIGLSGDNILIENVDIVLNRKTTSSDAYRIWAIRKYGDSEDYLTNSTLKNINIYGDFYQAVWLKDGGAGGDNITLENIFSSQGLAVSEALTNVKLSNCSFSYYSVGTSASKQNCLYSSMSPIVHYKLDENSGTIYDSSGNSNNSTVVNALTYGNTGAISNAISFDGNNSYIQIQNSPELQDLNHHITITAWIKPDILNDGCIVNKKWDTQPSGFDFRTYYGMLKFRFGNGTTTCDVYSAGNAYQVEQWQHVAVVYDTKNVKFYVNGNLQSSCPASGRIANNINPMYIGKHQGLSNYFNGELDDIRIYNRSLTSYQIKEAAYMRAFYKLEGNGIDKTGYNSAVIYGLPVTVASKVDNGIELDANNQVKQFLSAPDHNTLDMEGEITISAWIKPYSLPWSSIIMSKKWDSVYDGYQLKTYYRKLHFSVNGTNFITNNDLLDTEKLQHVTVVFNGVQAKFYINSILCETVSNSTSISPIANLCSLNIGAYQNTDYYRFDGIIDELRLFNCTLNDTEIVENFNLGWDQYQQQQ